MREHLVHFTWQCNCLINSSDWSILERWPLHMEQFSFVIPLSGKQGRKLLFSEVSLQSCCSNFWKPLGKVNWQERNRCLIPVCIYGRQLFLLNRYRFVCNIALPSSFVILIWSILTWVLVFSIIYLSLYEFCKMITPAKSDVCYLGRLLVFAWSRRLNLQKSKYCLVNDRITSS